MRLLEEKEAAIQAKKRRIEGNLYRTVHSLTFELYIFLHSSRNIRYRRLIFLPQMQWFILCDVSSTYQSSTSIPFCDDWGKSIKTRCFTNPLRPNALLAAIVMKICKVAEWVACPAQENIVQQEKSTSLSLRLRMEFGKGLTRPHWLVFPAIVCHVWRGDVNVSVLRHFNGNCSHLTWLLSLF